MTRLTIAKFIARWWPHILLCALSAAIAWLVTAAVWEARYQAIVADHATTVAEYATLQAEAQSAAREREHRMAEELAEVSSQYEGRIREIQSENDARVGELVAGTKRLRHEIAAYATASLSRDSASAGELSEAARDGAELVAAAIGAGAACDAQVIALQQAYEALRRPAP